MVNVMVVGFPRSGTTLVANQIGMKFNLAVAPETHFWSKVQHLAVERGLALGDHFRLRDLAVDCADLKLGSKPNGVLYFELMDRYRRKFPGVVGVIEKTPEHSLYIPNVIRANSKVKVVGIVRHPFGCILSLRKVSWYGKRSVIHPALSYFVNVSCLMLSKLAYRHNVRVIKFEELISQEGDVVSDLEQWLGLSYRKSGTLKGHSVPEWELTWKRNSADIPSDQSRSDHGLRLTPLEKFIIESINFELLLISGYRPSKLSLLAGLLLWPTKSFLVFGLFIKQRFFPTNLQLNPLHER